MKRRILILTNPGEKNAENYCAGVHVDAENYKSFFKAPYGGYWSDYEIIHLDKPQKSVLHSTIADFAILDFSIVIFCGHGWYSSKSSSNILELNSQECIDSNDLRKCLGKRIIILDSCREVKKEYISDQIVKARALFENVSLFSKLNPTSCKEHYNKSIEACPKQLIVSYATGVDELAGESSQNGGYYSNSLLKVAREWVEEQLPEVNLQSSHYLRNFSSCHNDAEPLVKILSGDKQHPQIEKPRLPDIKHQLPFIILA